MQRLMAEAVAEKAKTHRQLSICKRGLTWTLATGNLVIHVIAGIPCSIPPLRAHNGSTLAILAKDMDVPGMGHKSLAFYRLDESKAICELLHRSRTRHRSLACTALDAYRYSLPAIPNVNLLNNYLHRAFTSCHYPAANRNEIRSLLFINTMTPMALSERQEMLHRTPLPW